jgi:hypothetical protein
VRGMQQCMCSWHSHIWLHHGVTRWKKIIKDEKHKQLKQ